MTDPTTALREVLALIDRMVTDAVPDESSGPRLVYERRRRA